MNCKGSGAVRTRVIFFEDDEIGSHDYGGSWMVRKTAARRVGDAARYTGIGPVSIENWLRLKGIGGK